MKKIILALILISSTSLIKAQCFSYTGLSADVYGSVEDSLLHSYVYVINNSQNTIDASLNAYDVYKVPGTEHNFCWGILCYGVGVMSSAIPATINAGATEGSFRGDYLGHGYVGTTTVAYTVFDGNNPLDSVQFAINYHITPVGVKEVNKANSISAPSPNPARSITAFNYNVKSGNKAEVKVVNMLGKTVKSFSVSTSTGNIVLSTADLPSGVYFISLFVEGKNSAVQKLVVNR